jgi:hypothetical protein
MNDVVSFPLSPEVTQQRRRTIEVLDAWGLKAVYGMPGSKRPVERITEPVLAKVKPDDWKGSAAKFDMVDLDLDVRIKDDLASRAPDWSPTELAEVERTIFAPFRDALKECLGAFDFRAMFGRRTLGGNGHLLLRVAQDEELTIEERRQRLSQLQFEVNLGHFLVKLEVRQPSRKADSKVHCFLPGSIYPDDDLCVFKSLPVGPVSMANNVLNSYPLEALAKAVYRFALTIATHPLLGEGERHTTAMLVSGILRREVEQTERDGGPFTRNDAENLFRAIFGGDPEMRDRMHVFEQDFARTDTTSMPGYPALGERIGEETAQAMRLMLHGRDMGMFDFLRANIVFLKIADSRCVDLTQRTGTGELQLYSYTDLRSKYAHLTIKTGKKPTPAFELLKISKGRRQADDVIAIPGCPRGELLYQTLGGPLSLERTHDDEPLLINVSGGWATPYEPKSALPREEAKARLETMCSWLSPLQADRQKLLQMWGFKIQQPLVKPQFALGCYGGQGVGKNFVLHQLPQRLLGMSVKETTAEELFGDSFALNAALGASFLVVNEVKDLVNFSLAKGLARSEWHEVNRKYGGKGQARILAIPIYLTNEPHPQFNLAGETDRTLYIIRAPTQESMGLSHAEWETFKTKRKLEVVDMVEWLDELRNRMALMAVLMEHPVTQQELEDISTSDSLTEDYLGQDLSPEQLALKFMLEGNIVHPKADGRLLSVPFDKTSFDSGFNYYYMQHAPRGEKPLHGGKISKILERYLGRELGKLKSSRPNDNKRMYWFTARLGSLCDAFTRTSGIEIARDTPAHQEIGAYEPDAAEIRNAAASWSRVDTSSAF